MTLRKKGLIGFLIALLMVLSACTPSSSDPYAGYEKHTDSFFDTFDTMIQVVAYTESEEEFREYFQMIHERYQDLHRLYDIYTNYPGVNNIKTVNDQAGIAPVEVDKDLIDLILFSIEWYDRTEGLTNIALGPVLRIWHEYRAEALFDPTQAEIPSMDDLRRAEAFTDIHQIEVDEEAMTIYLPDSRMRLDIGAVAKGYATELIALEAAEAGLESAIISAGGNVRAIGKPYEAGRETWTVGLHNPDALMFSEGNTLLGTVAIIDASVVSSGDYQRFYTVGDQRLHHIIDPTTLMPANHYRAVTAVIQDSGLADFFSTELFILPYEESRALADSFDGLEAIWIMPDGDVEMTEGMAAIINLQP